eukprot:TRINITY_DN3901_c1_g2_i1.p1 TRINITY_DN3901_c1_g2~~TRINITY_DN3901_c1_g2_i1.p1  ORF type:complete len:1340 (-),score=272.96 TRINITY_DN3901_c1_g2_i1:102-4121(-)
MQHQWGPASSLHPVLVPTQNKVPPPQHERQQSFVTLGSASALFSSTATAGSPLHSLTPRTTNLLHPPTSTGPPISPPGSSGFSSPYHMTTSPYQTATLPQYPPLGYAHPQMVTPGGPTMHQPLTTQTQQAQLWQQTPAQPPHLQQLNPSTPSPPGSLGTSQYSIPSSHQQAQHPQDSGQQQHLFWQQSQQLHQPLQQLQQFQIHQPQQYPAQLLSQCAIPPQQQQQAQLQGLQDEQYLRLKEQQLKVLQLEAEQQQVLKAEQERERQELERRRQQREREVIEALRKEQEEETRRQEEQRRHLEEVKRQEELRRLEEQRRVEELRKHQEELRRAEEQRRAEELWRQQEQARLQEELKRQQEEIRKQEELKRQQEEIRRLVEMQRLEELRQQEMLRQQEELRRREELKRQQEWIQQQEEALRQEELRRQEYLLQQQEEVRRLEAAIRKQQEEIRKQEELRRQQEDLARQEELRRQEELKRIDDMRAEEQRQREALRISEALRLQEDIIKRQEELRIQQHLQQQHYAEEQRRQDILRQQMYAEELQRQQEYEELKRQEEILRQERARQALAREQMEVRIRAEQEIIRQEQLKLEQEKSRHEAALQQHERQMQEQLERDRLEWEQTKELERKQMEEQVKKQHSSMISRPELPKSPRSRIQQHPGDSRSDDHVLYRNPASSPDPTSRPSLTLKFGSTIQLPRPESAHSPRGSSSHAPQSLPLPRKAHTFNELPTVKKLSAGRDSTMSRSTTILPTQPSAGVNESESSLNAFGAGGSTTPRDRSIKCPVCCQQLESVNVLESHIETMHPVESEHSANLTGTLGRTSRWGRKKDKRLKDKEPKVSKKAAKKKESDKTKEDAKRGRSATVWPKQILRHKTGPDASAQGKRQNGRRRSWGDLIGDDGMLAAGNAQDQANHSSNQEIEDEPVENLVLTVPPVHSASTIAPVARNAFDGMASLPAHAIPSKSLPARPAVLVPPPKLQLPPRIFTPDQAAVLIQRKWRGANTRRHYEQIVFQARIAREILTSEQIYVNSLRVMIEVFILPLRKSCEGGSKGIISIDDIKRIFSNVEDIYQFNLSFLTTLESHLAHWHSQAPIANAFFVLQNDFVDMYSTYANLYDEALQTVIRCRNIKAFDAFLRRCQQHPECGGLHLEAFMILPIQRVPRYVILLRDLLRRTGTSHPEYQKRCEAVEYLDNICKAVNENKRTAENLKKQMDSLALLQAKLRPKELAKDLVTESRLLIFQGPILYYDQQSDKRKEVQLLLFSDMLFLTKPIKKDVYKITAKLSTTDHIRLEIMNDANDFMGIEMKNAFVLHTKRISYLLFCDTPDDRNLITQHVRQSLAAG